MAGYDDQAKDLYYLDDTAGSFDQDLVYALDAGVCHSVNQALAQAIQPIKHHLLGLVEQQGWLAPAGVQPIGESSLSTNTQAVKQTFNPHAADFESLLRNMARERDYNAGSQKKAVSDPASSSSSEHSSEQGDVPPRKHKKKAHHQEAPTPKTKLEAREGEKEESDRCRSRPHGRELRSGNSKILVRQRADERAEATKKERNRTLKPARGNATV
ncbi:hypothetical protein NDU88_004084 [Pleurodeles waltl]|uniref:Uncharacterized protein n=1 Tax=Pleurodeles waltl TaxID=8319 RepID=A0AAV7VIX0_PLEWA|nr:hypothetical protein NDU88_004084 [Pleurodeles waltl]